MIHATSGGHVKLYFNASEILATASGGVNITGVATASQSANITQVALTSSSNAVAWDASSSGKCISCYN